MRVNINGEVGIGITNPCDLLTSYSNDISGVGNINLKIRTRPDRDQTLIFERGAAKSWYLFQKGGKFGASACNFVFKSFL